MFAAYRLLNSWRGWDSEHAPVADAVWAMSEVLSRVGDVPVGLIGDSLGGRAALLAGSMPGVVSIAAPNPWVYPSDTADLSGRKVLVVHGSRDRIATLGRARQVARNHVACWLGHARQLRVLRAGVGSASGSDRSLAHGGPRKRDQCPVG